MPITIDGTGNITGLVAGGLPDGSINNADLATDAVSTSKILNGAVTTLKVADGAITQAKRSEQLTLGTAVASTSGTAIDFTGIPSWVKRVTVMFDGVSTTSTSPIGVAVGTSAGFITSGYEGGASNQAATFTANTNCLLINAASIAAGAHRGHAILTLISSNRWIFSAGVQNGSTNLAGAGGAITLSGTLDRVRITTVNGTDTFDAGSINIMYE
jgi:hypothetical protein